MTCPASWAAARTSTSAWRNERRRTGRGPREPAPVATAEPGPPRAGQTIVRLTYDELGFARDGAAAGFVTVQRSLVHPLAPGVGAEDGALAEPASVVYRGLSGAAIAPGWRALVVGDGTVALLAV